MSYTSAKVVPYEGRIPYAKAGSYKGFDLRANARDIVVRVFEGNTQIFKAQTAHDCIKFIDERVA